MSEPRDAGATRPGGRSGRVRSAVLKATLGELADRGLGHLRLERVAQRAGVHKTTVYRRWKDKETLIADALLERARERLPSAATGSLRSDLVQFGMIFVADLGDPAIEATVRTVASMVDRTSRVAQARRHLGQRWLELAREVTGFATERGQLFPGVDAHLLLAAIAGPIHFRLLITGEPLNGGFVERLAELVAAGVETRSARSPRDSAKKRRP